MCGREEEGKREEEEEEECVSVPARTHFGLRRPRQMESIDGSAHKKKTRLILAASGEKRRLAELVSDRPPDPSLLTAPLERTAVTWFPHPDRCGQTRQQSLSNSMTLNVLSAAAATATIKKK